MSDLSELNKELSFLTQDFENHKQLEEIRHKQINDNKYENMNNKWQQYQTFNINDKTHQPYQEYNTMQNNRNNNIIQQESQLDLRQDMNSRMDRFRFDSESNIKHTLVPVDMNHYYSGNLFMEGMPKPNNVDNIDVYNNNHSGYRNQSRLLHQEKSKTLYRNDVNERMAQFSPMGRTLHFPINQYDSNQDISFPQNIMTKTTRKNEMKADINTRLSGYSPLSSNTPLYLNNNFSRNEIISTQNNDNNKNDNINRQGKIKFQEMMPVSST